ncbi:site-specific integrase [Peribacillus sp. NPDC096379]|uniref:site-specific integrase n=1 Tax=Peribacillus sp. NPDC096379 TaxID=3364393 RepID=UPI003819CC38
MRFLDQKKPKSNKYESNETSNAYTKDVTDYFSIIRDQDIKFLKQEDMNIRLDDFEYFIEFLELSGLYANATINRKVSSVKSLLEYLHSKKIVNDISYLKRIKSKADDSERHGILTVSEVKQMSDLALEEREKGIIKKYFFLTGIKYCFKKRRATKFKVDCLSYGRFKCFDKWYRKR